MVRIETIRLALSLSLSEAVKHPRNNHNQGLENASYNLQNKLYSTAYVVQKSNEAFSIYLTISLVIRTNYSRNGGLQNQIAQHPWSMA